MTSFFSGFYVVYIVLALFVLFALILRAPIMAYRIKKKIFADTWYEAHQFYDEWPTEGGLRDNDCLGVYMLLVFDHPVTDGNYFGYENVYVGKAAKAYKGAYAQLVGRGNRKIYKDFRNPEKYIYIQARFYHRDDVDKMEHTLIKSLKADESYNAKD